ncbi:MAG: hypothetical protein JSV44_07925 [Candidatus Zixiibacteriota bacterium]|nr:MAG: hypothetical protein JSV44_07925 [candidate division Zixibacteria bacterium]
MAKERSLDDIEILERLRDDLYQAIMDNEPNAKVGDLVKVIELKRKLTVSGKAEKKFWDMINSIRKGELSGVMESKSEKKREKAK